MQNSNNSALSQLLHGTSYIVIQMLSDHFQSANWHSLCLNVCVKLIRDPLLFILHHLLQSNEHVLLNDTIGKVMRLYV